MANPITSGSLPRLMRPGLHDTFGLKYMQYPDEWIDLFEHFNSNMVYEEEQMITTMGLPKVRTEGSSIEYDDIKQSFPVRYTHIEYGLGFIVTRREVADNLYLQVADIRTAGLAFSMKQGKNYIAANIFNFAFSNTKPGGDAVSLINTSHPTEFGLQSNALNPSAEISETAIEELLIQIEDTRDNRGKKVGLLEECLLIPSSLQFESTRLLKNPQRPDTANRDINALYMMGRFPRGIIKNHFLTDPDAWFIKTNCPNGAKYFEREALVFDSDNDFPTDNMLWKCYERYSFGWSDWRGYFGSQGA